MPKRSNVDLNYGWKEWQSHTAGKAYEIWKVFVAIFKKYNGSKEINFGGGAKNDFLDPAISLPNKPELQIATQLLGFYPFFFMRDAFKK